MATVAQKQSYLSTRDSIFSYAAAFVNAQLAHSVQHDRVLPASELKTISKQFYFCSFLLFVAGSMSAIKASRYNRIDERPYLMPR